MALPALVKFASRTRSWGLAADVRRVRKILPEMAAKPNRTPTAETNNLFFFVIVSSLLLVLDLQLKFDLEAHLQLSQ